MILSEIKTNRQCYYNCPKSKKDADHHTKMKRKLKQKVLTFSLLCTLFQDKHLVTFSAYPIFVSHPFSHDLSISHY